MDGLATSLGDVVYGYKVVEKDLSIQPNTVVIVSRRRDMLGL